MLLCDRKSEWCPPYPLLPILVALLASTTLHANARQMHKMDFDWKFHLNTGARSPCPKGVFPIDMNNIQCIGLSQQSAVGADDCAAACCQDTSCEIWQWYGLKCNVHTYLQKSLYGNEREKKILNEELCFCFPTTSPPS